ncbi:MAG: PEGA domain-containing protein, partial [Myxococcales bacterium]|nr:PEGA domain-containing protein [Myxococcales bacterium]
ASPAPTDPSPSTTAPTVAGDTGSLVITAPPGVTIYLNGEKKEVQDGLLVTDSMPAGEYTLEARQPKRESWTTTIEVKGGGRPTAVKVPSLNMAKGKLWIGGEDAEGARVLVDGEEVGTVPYKGEIAVGEASIELRKRGFQTYKETIEIKEGDPTVLNPSLDRASVVSYGEVSLITVPWSNVTANGQKLGQTPVTARVRAGRVNLVLTTGDGQTFRRTITVRANKKTRERIVLK